jgi:hypothetical protein
MSMAHFRLSRHNLGVELGRHQGVVWFARGCKRCAPFGISDLVYDEAHFLFSCPATAVVRRERRIAQLPFTSLLQDLMCCGENYGVALFVHKCMTIADAAAVAAARLSPKLKQQQQQQQQETQPAQLPIPYSPIRQSTSSSFDSRLATFCRPRLLSQPLPPSSRMQASTNGRPVRPAAHLFSPPCVSCNLKSMRWHRSTKAQREKGGGEAEHVQF